MQGSPSSTEKKYLSVAIQDGFRIGSRVDGVHTCGYTVGLIVLIPPPLKSVPIRPYRSAGLSCMYLGCCYGGHLAVGIDRRVIKMKTLMDEGTTTVRSVK